MGIPDDVRDEAAEAAVAFQDLVDQANALFDQMCTDRHEMGQAKYGPVKFMTVNTLVEAGEEIVDLANYARYTFVKLYILNKQIDGLLGEAPDMLGPQSFMSSRGDQ